MTIVYGLEELLKNQTKKKNSPCTKNSTLFYLLSSSICTLCYNTFLKSQYTQQNVIIADIVETYLFNEIFISFTCIQLRIQGLGNKQNAFINPSPVRIRAHLL